MKTQNYKISQVDASTYQSIYNEDTLRSIIKEKLNSNSTINWSDEEIDIYIQKCNRLNEGIARHSDLQLGPDCVIGHTTLSEIVDVAKKHNFKTIREAQESLWSNCIKNAISSNLTNLTPIEKAGLFEPTPRYPKSIAINYYNYYFQDLE